ncbi:MAG: putative Mg2+ transporter-C (MgtC) family protein [Eubacteriales bacterium]|nr:putative Mg2+ transporter-C (MgtC) family protein [Eubacteriales bacterium]MDN5363116.1 putative Mg2+ transporter-C (MgtC) family protein [Eubacteriales bacterium]
MTLPSDLETVLRIMLAGIFGGIIGLERESLNKSAGFRTHILVCVGSALIMLVSEQIFLKYQGLVNADPGRIAAQVVSGIGFLGAGTIMREGANVKGLTTAASLWAVAGVGLALGAGFYFLAALATGIIFLALVYLGKVERNIAGVDVSQHFAVIVDDRPGMLGAIGSYLGERRINIQNVEMRKLAEEGKMRIELAVKLPPFIELSDIIYSLSELPGIYRIEIGE